jgi:tRNA acetyltransferase TAN1
VPVVRDFNVLATTSRGNERYACSELWYLLGEIGDSAPTIDKTGISGLIAAKVTLNPFDAIEGLHKILRERPYEFRFMLRIIPIEKLVRTDLGEIQRAVTELSSKIGEDETFRVTVEKRFSQIHTRDIIEVAAANIEQKVNLKNPDKIVLIEVVGGLTGVSVVKPQEILTVIKEKML